MQRRPSKLRVDYQHETLKILDYVDAGRRVEIEKLILKIMSKVNFKSINELSEHLRSRGIYGMKISSWQEGAFRVVKYIETNNLSEKAINKIQEDMELNQSNDRSLERWSEIILSKDNQKK